MRGLTGQLHSAAILAERAAVTAQHAELAGARVDVAVIGGLQRAADALYQHPRMMDPPLGNRRQYVVTTTVPLSGWALLCVAVLLAVPDPAQPWLLAATIAGGFILAVLLTGLADVIWDRHATRALPAGEEVQTVENLITTVRERLAAIAAALETNRDRNLTGTSQIETALHWLDAAEQAAADPTG